MSGCVPLNARYTVSTCRARVNVLVLLTLTLAEESLTCTLHEGIHNPQHARSKYHRHVVKLSLDKEKSVGRSHNSTWLSHYF